jgi:hypothetical protein
VLTCLASESGNTEQASVGLGRKKVLEPAPERETQRTRHGAQQFLDVRPSGCQHGVDFISCQAFQEAVVPAVGSLEVTDLRFHCAASFATFLLCACQPARGANGNKASFTVRNVASFTLPGIIRAEE